MQPARRTSHITQPDGTVIRVFKLSEYLMRVKMQVGRRLTPAEIREVKRQRAYGERWPDVAAEIIASDKLTASMES